MKKHGWLAILIGFILIIGCVFPSYADEQLPEEIRNALSGVEITHSAFWESPGSTWFVVIRTPGGTNILLGFEQQDGEWVQNLHTSTALPQGKAGVERLFITEKLEDFVYNRVWPGPILLILTDDGGYTSYQRSDSGQWNLFKVFWYDEQVKLHFDDESVIFQIPIDHDHNRFETVYGSFERDLRKTDLNRIPKTPAQAQTLLDETQPEAEKQTQP